MFNEKNSVEVVRRNLIAIRNKPNSSERIVRRLLSSSSPREHLLNNSVYGIGTKALLEVCEIANVDFSELFYIDTDWDLDNPHEMDYHNRTYTRELKPMGEFNLDNYEAVLYSNIKHYKKYCQHDMTSWWYAVGTRTMGKLKKQNGTTNFSVRILGRINDMMGVTPQMLMDVDLYRDNAKDTQIDYESEGLGDIYGL